MEGQKTMKVKCPHEGCGAVMTIPDTPGIADRMLACPICKYRDKVYVFIAEMNKPEDETEVCLSANDDIIGVLKISNDIYHLEAGRNTIGRKSPSSMADIQLSVDDMYMSRKHVCITVVKKVNGYLHQIENLTSRNKVIVNGNEMKEGEIIMLNYGDVIRLGRTDIHFVKE